MALKIQIETDSGFSSASGYARITSLMLKRGEDGDWFAVAELKVWKDQGALSVGKNPVQTAALDRFKVPLKANAVLKTVYNAMKKRPELANAEDV